MLRKFDYRVDKQFSFCQGSYLVPDFFVLFFELQQIPKLLQYATISNVGAAGWLAFFVFVLPGCKTAATILSLSKRCNATLLIAVESQQASENSDE